MAMTLITTNTSSGDAASDFTSGIDSTYKLYIFKYYNFNPSADGENFQVQFNAAGGSGFNETITTTYSLARHGEDNDPAAITYDSGEDRVQDTGGQTLIEQLGNGADEHASGTFWLFNPSNTTYVKHFYAVTVGMENDDDMVNTYMSGYVNTTSAIDEVRFYASGVGTTQDSVIKMYGVG